MNRHDRMSPNASEATLEYLDADLRVIKPGQFVRCAVTGKHILLDELRYWSVDRQEAYVDAQASLTRELQTMQGAPKIKA